MKKILSKLKYRLNALLGIAAKPRPIGGGKTQCWYGRANAWAQKRKTTLAELDAMADAGVAGYLIEMTGWGRYYGYKTWTPEFLSKVEKEYRWLLKQCRAHGLWLFVSIVNDNMGHGKYGDCGPQLDKVYSTALKAIDIVEKAGSANAIVQPVAETNTSAGAKYENECKKRLAGFPLVYNGSYGHPGGAPAGYHYFAVHPSKIDAKVSSAAFCVSDHGNIIRELAGGSLSRHASVDKLEKWRSNAEKKWKCPVLGYYAFKYPELDLPAIRALGTKK